jgi:hypothetical protein
VDLVVVNLVATAFMTGLVWFVQVVHYPLMGAVGEGVYLQYQRSHMRRTLWVVTGPMVVEGLTGVALVVWRPAAVSAAVAWAALGLLGVVWASTAVFQGPQHFALLEGYTAGTHRALVACNWVRTVAWTLRAALLLAALHAF